MLAGIKRTKAFTHLRRVKALNGKSRNATNGITPEGVSYDSTVRRNDFGACRFESAQHGHVSQSIAPRGASHDSHASTQRVGP